MWFVFKTLQTSSSVVYVSVTSKPVWQKQNPSDQWVDMTDYVLCVSSGVLGVVHTETLAPRGKLKNTKNSCLFCVCFVFLRRMSGFFFFFNVADEMGWVLKSQGMRLWQSRYYMDAVSLHTAADRGY